MPAWKTSNRGARPRAGGIEQGQSWGEVDRHAELPTPNTREPTRILVVADGLNRALYGVRRLLRQDREITYTFTRREAIRILDGGSFDFLLADSHLNEGSGRDVFLAGRKRNGQLHCLVVDLSESARLAMNAVEARIRGAATTPDILPEAA